MTNILTKKILNKIYISSIILFSVTSISKVILCTNLAVKSAQLNEYMQSMDTLNKEVSRLSFEDARLSNIKTVEENAYKLGFIAMENPLLTLDTEASAKVASISIH